MRQRIESALGFIGADDRETWVMCAMAIKAELGPDGFELWDAWSSQSESYNARDALAVWRSCRGGAVTIGSLFHEAKANGWRDDNRYVKPSPAQLQAVREAATQRATHDEQERRQRQQAAAKKAAWIMHQTVQEEHAYLHIKGWPEAKGAVWRPDEETNLLCVPMRAGLHLVGVQLIDKHGSKKYLPAQQTSGAEFVIDNSGPGALDWWVEGYATGLSLRQCLHALRLRYRIHVTFSAGNLKGMANTGLVVADRDDSKTGEQAAIATGLPYYLPQHGDFNDEHLSSGTFRMSQVLRAWLIETMEERRRA